MDFIHEEITECDIQFDFYILYMQTECDDPYYPPYNRNIAMFKSKEKAIEYARKKFYQMAEKIMTIEQRKYRGVEGMLYIEGDYFEDNDDKNTLKNNEPLYVIYDKHEQDKIDARWERMHGNKPMVLNNEPIKIIHDNETVEL